MVYHFLFVYVNNTVQWEPIEAETPEAAIEAFERQHPEVIKYSMYVEHTIVMKGKKTKSPDPKSKE